jgi:hypothetical protein
VGFFFSSVAFLGEGLQGEGPFDTFLPFPGDHFGVLTAAFAATAAIGLVTAAFAATELDFVMLIG